MLIYLLIVFFIVLLGVQITAGGRDVEGMDVDDMVIRDHDEIIMIKAQLEEKYKPLVVDSDGTPTNILTRIAKLEGDVQALIDNAGNQAQNKMDVVPPPPEFE